MYTTCLKKREIFAESTEVSQDEDKVVSLSACLFLRSFSDEVLQKRDLDRERRITPRPRHIRLPDSIDMPLSQPANRVAIQIEKKEGRKMVRSRREKEKEKGRRRESQDHAKKKKGKKRKTRGTERRGFIFIGSRLVEFCYHAA